MYFIKTRFFSWYRFRAKYAILPTDRQTDRQTDRPTERSSYKTVNNRPLALYFTQRATRRNTDVTKSSVSCRHHCKGVRHDVWPCLQAAGTRPLTAFSEYHTHYLQSDNYDFR